MSAPVLSSFDPAITPQCRCLIVGSMPGKASLQSHQYYAHPQNAFWWIMGQICGFDFELDYDSRVQCLNAAGFALWDTLKHCSRHGSLDQAIDKDTEVANDFSTLFQRYNALTLLAFNGAKSEQVFTRHHTSDVLSRHGLKTVRLPSSSPAHARLTRQQKLEVWRTFLGDAASVVITSN